MRNLLNALILTSSLVFAAPASAATEVITVFGDDNPFLAGKAPGTLCCSIDSAPGQSPAQILGALTAGNILTFSATGAVSFSEAPVPTGNPDGSFGFTMNSTYGTGIAGAGSVRANGLVGVFLDASDPGTVAPVPLSFASLNFASLSPRLRQIFWIGDGLTGTGIGSVQQFVIPVGATRLFLGSVDGFGWKGNTGKFIVTINGLDTVGGGGGIPEPATWAMMLLGFGLIGTTLRRRSATRIATTA